MSQTERIFFIDRKIRQRGFVRTSDVMEAFEVSDRQVKRDIEYLRERMCAPIDYDRMLRGYTYTELFPEFKNSDERLLVLNAIFRGVSSSQGVVPLMSDMIQDSIDVGISPEYRMLMDKIVFSAPIVDLPDYDVFGVICDAMQRKVRLAMRYQSGRGDETSRTIEALRLVNYSGRWYVVAWDMLRDALRNFHLSRIASIELTDEPVQEHCSEEELEQYVHNGFGIFMGGAPVEVQIKIMGDVVHSIKTQTWHKEQQVSPILEDEEGTLYLIMTLPVTNMAEILGKVLSFGSCAVPLSPPSFVEQWKAVVQEMADLI